MAKERQIKKRCMNQRHKYYHPVIRFFPRAFARGHFRVQKILKIKIRPSAKPFFTCENKFYLREKQRLEANPKWSVLLSLTGQLWPKTKEYRGSKKWPFYSLIFDGADNRCQKSELSPVVCNFVTSESLQNKVQNYLLIMNVILLL